MPEENGAGEALDRIRGAVDQMLDEGLRPSAIVAILLPLMSPGVRTPERRDIRQIVKDQHDAWLEQAEQIMRQYASDGSWIQLSRLLTTYQKVTK
jgi:hypothetical protein